MNQPKQHIININNHKQKKGQSYRVALLGDKGKEVKDGGGKGTQEEGSGGRRLQGRSNGVRSMHNGDNGGIGTQHTKSSIRAREGGGGAGNRVGGKGEWIGARGEGERRGGNARVFNYAPLGQSYNHENKDDYVQRPPKS